MLFWIIAVVISFLAMSLLWRSWTARLHQGVDTDDSDNRHYLTKIADIENDVAQGKITASEAESAKAEAARQLIRSKQSLPDETGSLNRASGWWMTLALVFIPVSSILVYTQTGNPPPLPGLQQESATPPEASVDQLVAVVEERLKEFPDDVQGWHVLAPVYLRQGRFGDAEIAFRNIIRIEGESTDVLAGLGEILVRKSGGIIDGQAKEVFERTLQMDSSNTTARFYLGEASLQNGDPATARTFWQSMIDDSTGNEDWLPMIRNRISALEGETDQAEGDSSPAIDPEAAEDILALPEQDRMTQINAMVARLAERLESEPEDKEGWVRLVTSYMVLGNAQKAKAAYDKASQIFPSDQSLLRQLEQIIDGPADKSETGTNE